MSTTTPALEPLDTRPGVEPELSVRGLRKVFGDLVAVDGLSFDIAPGETYGLLGPNGAGKTTAISMVAGIMAPDSGSVRVGGRVMSPRAIAAKGSLGYVPQEIALYPDLTGRENLLFFAGLYGLGRREARSRADEVLEAVSLRERAKDLARTYSGGMQRRLNIAIGLLHRPRLLVLDEPTVGVDPQSRNAILTGIEALSAQGMAVLYTTHYMEEAQRLCDRIGIVEGGRLIAEGTGRELTALVGGQDRIVLAATGELEAAAAALNAVADVHSATHGPDGLEVISADAGAALPAVLAAVAAAGVAVRSVAVSAPDLESVFLHLTGKTLRD